MAKVFIGVGSNVEPEKNIPRAMDLLAGMVRVQGISTFYRTDPVGTPGGTGPRFVNGVVKAVTSLDPADLKAALGGIEEALGRRRSADRNAPRTIDLDLLLYDGLVLSGKVKLPDPEIVRRPFLAVPLAELDPGLVLPGSGKEIIEIAADLASGASPMEPLPGLTASLREAREGMPAGKEEA